MLWHLALWPSPVWPLAKNHFPTPQQFCHTVLQGISLWSLLHTVFSHFSHSQPQERDWHTQNSISYVSTEVCCLNLCQYGWEKHCYQTFRRAHALCKPLLNLCRICVCVCVRCISMSLSMCTCMRLGLPVGQLACGVYSILFATIRCLMRPQNPPPYSTDADECWGSKVTNRLWDSRWNSIETAKLNFVYIKTSQLWLELLCKRSDLVSNQLSPGTCPTMQKIDTLVYH